jgi:hypothetical protein
VPLSGDEITDGEKELRSERKLRTDAYDQDLSESSLVRYVTEVAAGFKEDEQNECDA